MSDGQDPDPPHPVGGQGERPVADAPSGPVLPLVPGPWKELTQTQYSAFFKRLYQHILHRYDNGRTLLNDWQLERAWAVPPSCYPGWALVATDLKLGAQRGLLDVLVGPRFFWVLDGSNDILLGLNRGALKVLDGEERDGKAADISPIPSPLDLSSEDKARDYLRLFSNSLRSGGGTFRIVESADDLRRCDVSADLTPWTQHLRPPELRKSQPGEGDAAYVAEAAIYYGGTLSAVQVHISADGKLTMVHDEALAQNIGSQEETSTLLRRVRPSAP